jgi:hypothetical protein
MKCKAFIVSVIVITLILVSSGCIETNNKSSDVEEFKYDGVNEYGYYNYTGKTDVCPSCDGSGKCRRWVEATYYDDPIYGKILIKDGYFEDCYGNCYRCDGSGIIREIVYIKAIKIVDVGDTSWFED